MPMKRTIAVLVLSAIAAVGIGAAVVLFMVGTGPQGSVVLPLMLAFAPGAVVLTAIVLIGPARLRRWGESPRARSRIAASAPLVGGVIFLAGILILSRRNGGSLLAQLIEYAPMLLVVFGAGVATQFVRRTGTDPLCAKCGYAAGEGATEADPEIARCPECGAFWLRPGGIVKGRTERRPKRLIIGLAMLALGFGLIATQFSRTGFGISRLALLPTSSLIKEIIAAPRGFTMDEWAALSKRTLTPDQERELAEGLLAQRLRKQYLDQDAEAWLESYVLTGSIPGTLRDRYFAEMVELALVANHDRVRVGDAVEIKVGSTCHGSLHTPGATTLRTHVLFGGFRKGGDGPQCRQDEPTDAISFGLAKASGGLTFEAPQAPRLSWTAASPGAESVTAECWVIVSPPVKMPVKVAWLPDGTPSLPPGLLSVRHIVLEKTVTVDP